MLTEKERIEDFFSTCDSDRQFICRLFGAVLLPGERVSRMKKSDLADRLLKVSWALSYAFGRGSFNHD